MASLYDESKDTRIRAHFEQVAAQVNAFLQHESTASRTPKVSFVHQHLYSTTTQHMNTW